jgi:HK97 family phage portal protein
MSVLSQLGNQLVKLGGRLLGKPLVVGSRVFPLSTPESFATMDSQRAVSEGFSGNTSIYSIVMEDAQKFGSIPFYVYDANKKEEKALHPLMEVKALTRLTDGEGSVAALTTLLNRPNPYQSQDMFLTTVRAYYKVCGEAMIWLNRGDIEEYRLADGSFDDMEIDRLPVLEMYCLPPDKVTVIPDPTNPWGVAGYILEAGERNVMRAGDVIHWKNVNLAFDTSSRSHLRGMPPLTPGSEVVAENRSISRAAMRMAQNDGAKAILHEKTLGAKMSPEQQSQVKKVIDAKINNNDVAGSVAMLQGDWGLLNLAMSSKDMEMIEKKKMSWQELCFLFGVPNEFFDTQTTFANKEQAMIQWLTNKIIPACKQFAGELNRTLLKAFNLESVALIAADWSELPEAQKAMVEAAKVMQDIWSVSPDDVRQVLGFEPLGGKFAEPWVPMGRTPISEMNDGAEEIEKEINARRSAGY